MTPNSLREVTVGRGNGCDITLDPRCQYASSMHATIYIDGNRLMFKDVSSNGTLINNVLVHHRAVPINPGDSIMLAGKYPLNWNQINSFIPVSEIGMPPRFTPPVNQISGTEFMSSPVTDTVSLTPSLETWNWGAFGINGLWGLFNGCWWMFVINIVFGFLSSIPFVGVATLVIQVPYLILCGIKGTAWAWNAKQWESVEKFERTQKNWGIAGIIVFCLLLISWIMAFAALL
ncbi:MAG: FHA domain-containing protein [Bacteroidales bacterium]|nr:FHA domain-containing protein [Bacteroidales bacterium]